MPKRTLCALLGACAALVLPVSAASAAEAGWVSHFSTFGFTPSWIVAGPGPAGPSQKLFYTFSARQKLGALTPTGTDAQINGSMQEFPNPGGGGEQGTALGSDGNLWFGGFSTLGKMTPAGVFTEFELTEPDNPEETYLAQMQELISVNGQIWFTTGDRSEIGRVPINTTPATVNQDVDYFEIAPGTQYFADNIVAGPEGNIWFTAYWQSGCRKAIGRITPAGTVTLYSAGLTSCRQVGITVGPDGKIWFVDGDRVGRLDPAKTTDPIVEFLPPAGTGTAALDDIAAGPDGNLWFTAQNSRIGRITPSGTITMFDRGVAGNGKPGQITAGPDGSMWFTTQSSIARITTSASTLPDGDGDGVPDANDLCPAVSETGSPGTPRSGCPADADADGIVDGADSCPSETDISAPNNPRNGCLSPDSDGDGLRDTRDACPTVSDLGNQRTPRSGCPAPAGAAPPSGAAPPASPSPAAPKPAVSPACAAARDKLALATKKVKQAAKAKANAKTDAKRKSAKAALKKAKSAAQKADAAAENSC